MEKKIENDFLSALLELDKNSKFIIENITKKAIENVEDAAIITSVVQKYIANISSEIKLPLLYLIDSIIKSDKSANYANTFSVKIVSIFTDVFSKVSTHILTFQ